MKVTRINNPAFNLELSDYDARCLFALISGLTSTDIRIAMSRYNPKIGNEYQQEPWPKFESRLYQAFAALGFRIEED